MKTYQANHIVCYSNHGHRRCSLINASRISLLSGTNDIATFCNTSVQDIRAFSIFMVLEFFLSSANV